MLEVLGTAFECSLVGVCFFFFFRGVSGGGGSVLLICPLRSQLLGILLLQKSNSILWF